MQLRPGIGSTSCKSIPSTDRPACRAFRLKALTRATATGSSRRAHGRDRPPAPRLQEPVLVVELDDLVSRPPAIALGARI